MVEKGCIWWIMVGICRKLCGIVYECGQLLGLVGYNKKGGEGKKWWRVVGNISSHEP